MTLCACNLLKLPLALNFTVFTTKFFKRLICEELCGVAPILCYVTLKQTFYRLFVYFLLVFLKTYHYWI